MRKQVFSFGPVGLGMMPMRNFLKRFTPLLVGYLMISGFAPKDQETNEMMIPVNVPLENIFSAATLNKIFQAKLSSFESYTIINKGEALHLYAPSGDRVILHLDQHKSKITQISCQDIRPVFDDRDLSKLLSEDLKRDIRNDRLVREQHFESFKAGLLNNPVHELRLDKFPEKRLDRFRMKRMLRAGENVYFETKEGSGVCFSFRLGAAGDGSLKDHVLIVLQDKDDQSGTHTRMALIRYDDWQQNATNDAWKGVREKKQYRDILEMLMQSNDPEISIFSTQGSPALLLTLKALFEAQSKGFSSSAIRINRTASDEAVGVVLKTGKFVRLIPPDDSYKNEVRSSLRN